MCICQKCGNEYDVDFIVPDWYWEEIRPNKDANADPESGLMCPECIVDYCKNEVRYGDIGISRINIHI